MQTARSLRPLVLCAMLLAASPVIAGPFTEFEAQLRLAYAPYRNALFQTNKKDQAASEQALKKFTSDWATLTARWGSQPPPQYADDASFNAVLGEITIIIEKAHGTVSKGELAEAHEILEKIRDILGDLRSRNGIVTFSDRMNAYHEAMEHVLTKPYGGFDAKGLGELREDASVLAYLYGPLEKHRPAGVGGNPEFVQALSAVKSSVDGLLASIRTGEAAATRQAIQKLKQPYAVLFLKFG